jgi:hypothetical protein
MTTVGKQVPRIDALDKVTGLSRLNNDSQFRRPSGGRTPVAGEQAGLVGVSQASPLLVLLTPHPNKNPPSESKTCRRGPYAVDLRHQHLQPRSLLPHQYATSTNPNYSTVLK